MISRTFFQWETFPPEPFLHFRFSFLSDSNMFACSTTEVSQNWSDRWFSCRGATVLVQFHGRNCQKQFYKNTLFLWVLSVSIYYSTNPLRWKRWWTWFFRLLLQVLVRTQACVGRLLCTSLLACPALSWRQSSSSTELPPPSETQRANGRWTWHPPTARWRGCWAEEVVKPE